jgi:ABC-type transport system involved in multi-copper enzyme maturation permease subunit
MTESFFIRLVMIQFATVLLLTPACTASALTEEKERRTLEYLLATDLGGHEIVLGKMLSRVAYLALIILTGLPFLSFLQLLGGIDPNLVLLSFAATSVTLLSLASLSIFNSAWVGKSRTAVILTYLELIAYLVITSALVPLAGGPLFGVPGIRWLVAGNIFTVVWQLFAQAASSTGLGGNMIVIFEDYLLFHAAVTLLCAGVSVLLFRRWSLRQEARRGRKAFVLALGQKRRPPIGKDPVLWKELYAEPMLRLSRLSVTLLGTFVSVCLIFGLFIFMCAFVIGQSQGQIPEHMNRAVRLIGTMTACLILLGVAIRAAGTVGAERERDTLDGLLTTPLEGRHILWPKYLGSILGMRKALWVLGAMWLAGVCTGGVHPLALLLLLVSWCVYAAFFASLGLWLSVTCRTMLRSLTWTGVITFGLSVGHWLLTMCFLPVFLFLSPTPLGRRNPLVLVQDFLGPLISPPANLGTLAFFEREWMRDSYYQNPYVWDGPSQFMAQLGFSILGLSCYALAAFLLWHFAKTRFEARTGRLRAAQPARPRKP